MNEIHYDGHHIIDTSSLIDLQRMNPQDIYKTPWNKLEEIIESGYAFAPKYVFDEICREDDEVSRWVRKIAKKFIVPLNDFQLQKVKELRTKYPSWVSQDEEKTIADPYVVALAMEKDSNQTLFQTIKKRIVVTQETIHNNQVKIPLVCRDNNIECIKIFDLFRRLGWQF